LKAQKEGNTELQAAKDKLAQMENADSRIK
jgi:hypothetical protein